MVLIGFRAWKQALSMVLTKSQRGLRGRKQSWPAFLAYLTLAKLRLAMS